MFKKLIYLFVFTMIFNSVSYAAELTAKVGNNEVVAGSTFELIISYNGTDGGSLQPDLKVLQRDFAVYSTSSSIMSINNNGNMSQNREWRITLMPKQEGNAVIPAITAGKYKTKPINIKVLPAGSVVKITDNTSAATDAKFQAKLTVSDDNPYLQEEIAAVLRISGNRDLKITQEPQFIGADDWEIRRLDGVETETENGKQVIVLKYLLFPQKSGVLELPGAEINGYYITFEENNMPSRNGFGFNLFAFGDGGLFGVQKPVVFRSNPVKITIKPIPPVYGNAWWLPTKALNLTAHWVDKKPKFKVGETVAREITLTAAGVTESQLPDIELAESDDWKQYPEKPQYSSAIHENQTISQEIIRVVYIPQKDGKLTLPEIKVRWFNLKTLRVETALIPAETVNVEAGRTVDIIKDTEKDFPDVIDNTKADVANEPVLAQQNKNDNLLWILVAAFAAGMAVSFLLFRRRPAEKTRNQAALIKSVEHNLAVRDYRALRGSLLEWGNKTFGEGINNLNDLMQHIADKDFDAQMQLLNEILYSGRTADLDGRLILMVVRKKYNNRKKSCSDEPLPSLYK